jgi:VCBS repeat-containing protein
MSSKDRYRITVIVASTIHAKSGQYQYHFDNHDETVTAIKRHMNGTLDETRHIDAIDVETNDQLTVDTQLDGTLKWMENGTDVSDLFY